MRTRVSLRSLSALALAALVSVADAHSWPERTQRIAPNGTMVGTTGTDRSHAARGSRPEDSIVWLIPPNGREKKIRPDDKIARPDQRALTATSYSDKFPMLKVAPGDFVAIQYTENGHVSKAEVGQPTKPVNRGTVYLYGTTNNDLTNANLMDIHLAWTADGKGGDGKGRLLATRNYDDGQCFEAIPSVDTEGITSHRMKNLATPGEPLTGGLMCQSDVQVPFDVPVGQVYTVIWVWDWPTMNVQGVAVPPATYNTTPSASGEPFVTIPEIYTGVVDLKVVDACDESLGEVKGPGCSAKGAPKGAAQKNVVQYGRQNRPSAAAIHAHLVKPFLVDVPQAGQGATAAKADPKDIPMDRLIGVKAPVFPLAPSFFPSPGSKNPDVNPPAPPALAPTSGSSSTSSSNSRQSSTRGSGSSSTSAASSTATSSSGPSRSPSPSFSKNTRLLTSSRVSPTAAPSAGPSRQDGILYVTVTVPAATVTVTKSVVVPAPTGTGSPARRPSATVPRVRRIRHARGLDLE